MIPVNIKRVSLMEGYPVSLEINFTVVVLKLL